MLGDIEQSKKKTISGRANLNWRANISEARDEIF